MKTAKNPNNRLRLDESLLAGLPPFAKLDATQIGEILAQASSAVMRPVYRFSRKVRPPTGFICCWMAMSGSCASHLTAIR